MKNFFAALGVAAWVLALILGIFQTAEVREPTPTGERTGTVPNTVTGLMAVGFAVGGGLAFIAAALQGREDRDERRARRLRAGAERLPEHLAGPFERTDDAGGEGP